MISYERINKSEGIDFKKGENPIKCMICSYSYFKDIGFKYQQYVCNECHDFSMSAINLKDFFVSNIIGIDYRVYISNIDKKDAVNILKNSKLSNKAVL